MISILTCTAFLGFSDFLIRLCLVFTGLFSLVLDFDLDCTFGGRVFILGACKASLTCFPTLEVESDPIKAFFYAIITPQDLLTSVKTTFGMCLPLTSSSDTLPPTPNVHENNANWSIHQPYSFLI